MWRVRERARDVCGGWVTGKSATGKQEKRVWRVRERARDVCGGWVTGDSATTTGLGEHYLTLLIHWFTNHNDLPFEHAPEG